MTVPKAAGQPASLNLEYALEYLSKGFTVIPLKEFHDPHECRPKDDAEGPHVCPQKNRGRGSKEPCISNWNHWAQARPSEQQVRDWWTEFPNAGIGILGGSTSAPSGKSLIIHDFDTPSGFQQLFGGETGMVGSTTPVQKTHRGYHVFVYAEGDYASGKIPELGLDLQAARRYVAVQPTIHPKSGQPYTWVKSPLDTPVHTIPLYDQFLTSKGYTPPPPVGESSARLVRGEDWLTAAFTVPVTDGEGRHGKMVELVGYLVGKHPGDVALNMALLWNRAMVIPPLPESEIERAVRHCVRGEERQQAEAAVTEGLERIGDYLTTHESSIIDDYLNPTQHLGLQTRFARFNKATGGFEAGQLYGIGGRPGAHKTHLAFEIGLDLARRGNKVICFSLEQGKQAVINRWLQPRIGISRYALRARGRGLGADSQEHRNLKAAIAEFKQYPLWLDDTPGMSIQEMRRRIDVLTEAGQRPDIVILDYLNLLETDDAERNDNLYAKVTLFVTRLGALVKNYNLPALVTFQLNREAAEKTDKDGRPVPPQAHQGRDSGAIEQRFDNLFLLEKQKVKYGYERDEHGLPRPQGPERLNLWVAKQKDGPSGFAIPFELEGPGRHLIEAKE